MPPAVSGDSNTRSAGGFGGGPKGPMQRPDERELREQLARLRAEHRDLDAQIVAEELSAHADQAELMRWLSGFRRAPDKTYVVHGEAGPAQALAARIVELLGWDAEVARDGVTVPLFGT